MLSEHVTVDRSETSCIARLDDRMWVAAIRRRERRALAILLAFAVGAGVPLCWIARDGWGYFFLLLLCLFGFLPYTAAIIARRARVRGAFPRALVIGPEGVQIVRPQGTTIVPVRRCQWWYGQLSEDSDLWQSGDERHSIVLEITTDASEMHRVAIAIDPSSRPAVANSLRVCGVPFRSLPNSKCLTIARFIGGMVCGAITGYLLSLLDASMNFRVPPQRYLAGYVCWSFLNPGVAYGLIMAYGKRGLVGGYRQLTWRMAMFAPLYGLQIGKATGRESGTIAAIAFVAGVCCMVWIRSRMDEPD